MTEQKELFRLGAENGPIVYVRSSSPKMGLCCRVEVGGIYHGAFWEEGTLIWAEPREVYQALEQKESGQNMANTHSKR